MSDYVRIIDRSKIYEGLSISRRTNAPISKAIVLATGIRTRALWRMIYMGYSDYVATIIGLSHDAMIVRDPVDGILKVGDALMSEGCVLTPLEDWEQGCMEGDRILFGRPAGITEAGLKGAAAHWINHVMGNSYDKVAIGQLLTKVVFGDHLSYKIGLLSDFFCTEANQTAYAIGGGIDPYWPNKNATPGTSTRRYLDNRIEEVDCFTAEGRSYRLNIN